MAGSRIKEIKDNSDWYQSTGLLKGWYYFNYRKVRGPRWSEVLTALPQEELKEQLATMTGMDIEIRMKQYVTKGYNQPPTLFHQRYNLPQTAHP